MLAVSPAIVPIKTCQAGVACWPTSRLAAFPGFTTLRHRTEGSGNAGLRRSHPLLHRVPDLRDLHHHQRGLLLDEPDAGRADLPCPPPVGHWHRLGPPPVPPLMANLQAPRQTDHPAEGWLRR